MEARELRIGNWFLDNEADPTASIYWQVEEITKEGINYRSGSCWTKSGCIEPIPLTEEWLEKFRFEKNAMYYDVDMFGVVKFTDGKYHFQGKESIVIEYVHQLQNLYFALTGEELELNK